MKTKLNDSAAQAVNNNISKFTTREFPGFVTWLREQWEANPPAILAVNPPNH